MNLQCLNASKDELYLKSQQPTAYLRCSSAQDESPLLGGAKELHSSRTWPSGPEGQQNHNSLDQQTGET
jgi:hypothetical protein